MTARDEAIAAMLATSASARFAIVHEGEMGRHCRAMLDAIPGDVLARLAIERDAFELAGLDPHTDVQLYRLAEP